MHNFQNRYVSIPCSIHHRSDSILSPPTDPTQQKPVPQKKGRVCEKVCGRGKRGQFQQTQKHVKKKKFITKLSFSFSSMSMRQFIYGDSTHNRRSLNEAATQSEPKNHPTKNNRPLFLCKLLPHPSADHTNNAKLFFFVSLFVCNSFCLAHVQHPFHE